MSLSQIEPILSELPRDLRSLVRGYAAAVDESTPEIFRDSNRVFDATIADQLVFMAAIRKLWSVIDSQFWIVDNSLAIAGQSGVQGLRVGSSRFARGSADYQRLLQLHSDLDSLVQQLGIIEYIQAGSLSDVLELLSK